ncbi:hypothetical protein [Brachyspira pilosicoli]|uniref:hypothetical protein n=1 Tax=Brachyspira pilosicoli TaxID=52584 RepID=UPI002666525A|nr:hypothetical protein [Brachyspira pilosicoli]
MNKKILSIFVMIMALSLFGVSCSNEDSTGTGGNNSGTTGGSGTPTPLTKEEVVKFQGTWGSDNLSKVSGDAAATEVVTASFTINADGSIKDEVTQQTIALDKINKVSDNVFEFTSEATEEGAKTTLKHKVDFTDNNAPKDTLVCTEEAQGQSYSATYEGTLSKQTQKGVKFQGTWGSDNLSKVSGDAAATEVVTASFTINADGSIKDEVTQQTIALDKINKVSDNVFEFTYEVTHNNGGKTTYKHKVDFTDNNAPKDTVDVVLTMKDPVESYSATYEGTLKKQP